MVSTVTDTQTAPLDVQPAASLTEPLRLPAAPLTSRLRALRVGPSAAVTAHVDVLVLMVRLA